MPYFDGKPNTCHGKIYLMDHQCEEVRKHDILLIFSISVTWLLFLFTVLLWILCFREPALDSLQHTNALECGTSCEHNLFL